MTISQALMSLNTFPIPDLFIEKVGVDRGLTVLDEYTLEISKTKEYRLATADVYLWLYGQVTFKEQEVSFSQQEDIKNGFLSFANSIYKEYDDPKFSGETYGFIGEDWNG